MPGPHLFYYFGDDEAYFRALNDGFRKLHGKSSMKFSRFYESDESKIQSFFLKIHNDKPAVVFIDFSKQTQDYLHLARLLARSPFDFTFILVGLLDYLSPPELLKESIATGTNLTFIKSAENFDVVFSVGKLLRPDDGTDHGFANASLKEAWEAGVLCKIGYVHSEGLHIETDYKLSKGDRVILEHHWFEKKIVPSKQVSVKDSSSINMFYQFKFNADLDFMFIDDFFPPEGMSEARIKEKLNQKDGYIKYHKKQLERWINDNLDTSLEKQAKILVVDKQFHFYQNQARTDKYPYIIRCVPFFNDIQQELDRLRPKVIAIEIEAGEVAKNSLDSLKKLVQLLLSNFSDLNPYIMCFNTKETSQNLQTKFHYTNILSHADELSPDLLIKLADLLQKKLTISSQEKAKKDDLIKKQLKHWLDDNLDSSQEKWTKILVVDTQSDSFQNKVRPDKHTYTMRCIPHLTEIQQELDQLKPKVIAIEIESGENAKNTLDALQGLVQLILSNFADLNPYIICFNTKETTQNLQNILQYSNILSLAAELSPDLLIKLADLLQTKLTNTSNEKAQKDDQVRVYIKKNNVASLAKILKTVTVIKISETDMIIQSEFPFLPGTNLHFTKPVQMFVNVQPIKKPSGKTPEYHGLIHSIGEIEKKELRHFVNSVFFRDHDAQLIAENEEFKKLNEAKLIEKNSNQEENE